MINSVGVLFVLGFSEKLKIPNWEIFERLNHSPVPLGAQEYQGGGGFRIVPAETSFFLNSKFNFISISMRLNDWVSYIHLFYVQLSARFILMWYVSLSLFSLITSLYFVLIFQSRLLPSHQQVYICTFPPFFVTLACVCGTVSLFLT